MELPLQPPSELCAVTGAAFVAGDRVVSYLSHDAEGAFVRVDCLASAEADLPKPAEVLCRWTRIFKPRTRGGDAEREMKLTAEALFLSLVEDAESVDENAQLKQFLALMLERKRVLRRKGFGESGAVRYEHAKSKQMLEVPAVEMDAAFFVSVRDKLGPLLGDEPSGASESGAGAAATDEGA